MNSIQVLFFATLKDMAGTRRITLELPEGATVIELKRLLAIKFPVMKPALRTALVSINREFALDEEVLPAQAEVALFPPVSGGNLPTYLAITEEVLDLDDLQQKIILPQTGAICCFTGIVRGITQRYEPHETIYLEYEAYTSMAEAKMQQVADEIRSRWPAVEGIAIVQRIGKLEAGTPTVIIVCSASHRDTGVFEAARYGIDRLKEIVPIWKKEVGPQGEAWIEGTYFPGPGE